MNYAPTDLPFAPPFRVVSEYSCGTDAHIVDSAGNVIIESSAWVSNPDLRHKKAMTLICDVLNKNFRKSDAESIHPESKN